MTSEEFEESTGAEEDPLIKFSYGGFNKFDLEAYKKTRSDTVRFTDQWGKGFEDLLDVDKLQRSSPLTVFFSWGGQFRYFFDYLRRAILILLINYFEYALHRESGLMSKGILGEMLWENASIFKFVFTYLRIYAHYSPNTGDYQVYPGNTIGELVQDFEGIVFSRQERLSKDYYSKMLESYDESGFAPEFLLMHRFDAMARPQVEDYHLEQPENKHPNSNLMRMPAEEEERQIENAWLADAVQMNQDHKAFEFCLATLNEGLVPEYLSLMYMQDMAGTMLRQFYQIAKDFGNADLARHIAPETPQYALELWRELLFESYDHSLLVWEEFSYGFDDITVQEDLQERMLDLGEEFGGETLIALQTRLQQKHTWGPRDYVQFI